MANPPDSSPQQDDGSFHAIRRFISRKTGEFGLLFAVFNDFHLRERSIASLRKEIPGQHLIVRLTFDTVDPLSEILTALPADSPRPAAIHLLHLAAAAPSDQSRLRALHALNLRRGQWEKLSCPVVLWIPEYLIGLLLKHAPDFSNWRSGSPFLTSHIPSPPDFTSASAALPITPGSADAQRQWSLLSDRDLRLSRMKELSERMDQAIANSKRQLASSQRELALIFARENQPDQCHAVLQRLREKSKSAGEIHFLHATLIALFNAWDQSGNFDERAATATMLESSARQRHLKAPNSSRWQRDFAVSLNALGEISISRGNFDEAARLFGEGLAIIHRLVEKEPQNTKWQRNLSVSYSKLGDLAMQQGKTTEAAHSYDLAHQIIKQLADSDPGILVWQRDLALSFERLGNVNLLQTSLEAAAKLYQQALKIRSYLAGWNPENLQWQQDLSRSHLSLGDIAVETGDLVAAEKCFRNALNISLNLFARDQKNTQWQQDLSIGYERLGGIAQMTGNLAEAAAWYEKSKSNWENLLTVDRNNRQWRRGSIVPHARMSDLAFLQGDKKAETLQIRKHLQLLEEMEKDGLPLSLEDRDYLDWLQAGLDEDKE